jgi:dTDP-4-dehydrorhamnose reductase
MKKLVLLGADGQLGSTLAHLINAPAGTWTLRQFTLNDFDVRNHELTRQALEKERPEVVINTTAYLRVDDCEDQCQMAFDVNAVAVHNMAKICKSLDATLVHFSTDYVFGGDAVRAQPYVESDLPWPQSVYAASKLAGEHMLTATWDKHLLIRSCGLYGAGGSLVKGTNFVESMLRLADSGKDLKVVNDQRLTPTATTDLAEKVMELVNTGSRGLFHVTNSGDCTWFEFAQEIFRLAHKNVSLAPTTTAAYGARAKRPAYSVLQSERLEHSGLALLRPWPDALRDYLQRTGRLHG